MIPIDQPKTPRDDMDLNQTPSFFMPFDLFKYIAFEKIMVPTEINTIANIKNQP